jgi:hypothetical protein
MSAFARFVLVLLLVSSTALLNEAFAEAGCLVAAADHNEAANCTITGGRRSTRGARFTPAGYREWQWQP